MLGGLGSLLFFVFIDFRRGILGRCEEMDILYEDSDRLALEIRPGDGEGEVAQVAFFDVDGQTELV